jgi:hypothetical protein
MPSFPVTLPPLLGKAEAVSTKISPLGQWIAWLVRGDAGVLNLWAAPVAAVCRSPEPTLEIETNNPIPGAFQLTKVSPSDQRDICFSFWFSRDDRKILYLRETNHGSELYHLYALDLPAASDAHRPAAPVESGKDLLQAYPHLTCAVGFVGGLQLWLPAHAPETAILSTGTGSLLWDLSSLNLETGELSSLYVCFRWSYTPIVFAAAFHVTLRCLFFALPHSWWAHPEPRVFQSQFFLLSALPCVCHNSTALYVPILGPPSFLGLPSFPALPFSPPSSLPSQTFTTLPVLNFAGR